MRDEALDAERTLSCGHKYTLRHAACPTCFAELQAELAKVGQFGPFKRRGADALAFEVAVLVRRGIIDSRSPAADALLDYQDPEPPSSERADRVAALEDRLAMARSGCEHFKAERDEWTQKALQNHGAARELQERLAFERASREVAEARANSESQHAAEVEVRELHQRQRIEGLEAALRDLLESADLIRDWAQKYGRTIVVIDGFLLGAHERARKTLEGK